MNGERNLEERATRHAALAEPVRLHIVDLLSLGDWSPSELQLRLQLPSNLLAHHLNALERASLITRDRSEADKRRSYVRLNRSALDDLGTAEPVRARRVVFVCTGNSARSQLAAALWSHASSIPAASGGTHPADRIEPRAVEVANQHGLGLLGKRPQLLAQVLRGGDLVVTVCDNAHEEASITAALHWSIPDPVRVGTDAAFERAFEQIAARVGDLAPWVAASV
ncbi:MAG: helix-turn-helix domain-containing protein [Pseudolysinimonas sp.]